MSPRLKAILERRASLVERADAERDQLADAMRIWRGPLRMVDEGVSFVQAVRRAPPVLGVGFAVAGVAAAIARPRGFARWVDGGLRVWRLASSVVSSIRGAERDSGDAQEKRARDATGQVSPRQGVGKGDSR